MNFYYGNNGEKGYKLYAFGPLEITLIVVAVILVFGVGKLANVGGALGKSIREFRKEKDKIDDAPKLTTKETQENKSEDESKD
ncbi:twin-arginine translocase TatA/TatE family subunit [Chloroflexota bacterium]